VYNFSEKIKDKLSVLTDDFKHQLPQRILTIKNLFNELVTSDGQVHHNSNVFKELHRHVHKLSGSAATFGYQEVSDIAKQMENLLGTLDNREEHMMDSEKIQLRDHLSKLQEYSGTDQNEEIVEELSEEVERIRHRSQFSRSKRLIYLIEPGKSIDEEIVHQVGIFGYELFTVHSVKEVEQVIDRDVHSIIIINSSYLAADSAAVEKLWHFKNDNADIVNYIFVSEADDFDIRLKSVRSGGDAFFQFPLDISRLIDRIEMLSSKRDEDPYHILIIDDDPEQVSFNALLLQQAGMITSVARDPSQVIKLLIEAKPELILMDMYMPGCDGMELASIIRQQEAFVSIPIVFLSVEADMDKQIAAIMRGGDDFLTKPIRPDHLIASITNRAERTRSMRYLMERDSLTGLLNHTNLKEQLYREIMRAKRTGSSICFAMIDVDRFKKVNDTFGHLTGDRVLKGLARMLQERLRSTDIIGRYGGEEFAVVLLNTDIDNAKRIMNEIRDKFSKFTHRFNNTEFSVTFSCGIASYPDFPTAVALNESADKALYEAKEKGRNRVILARPT
jgi:diguanylate cyclase (GGDEF)-like protein